LLLFLPTSTGITKNQRKSIPSLSIHESIQDEIRERIESTKSKKELKRTSCDIRGWTVPQNQVDGVVLIRRRRAPSTLLLPLPFFYCLYATPWLREATSMVQHWRPPWMRLGEVCASGGLAAHRRGGRGSTREGRGGWAAAPGVEHGAGGGEFSIVGEYGSGEHKAHEGTV
jgi:hypothetical protein